MRLIVHFVAFSGCLSAVSLMVWAESEPYNPASSTSVAPETAVEDKSSGDELNEEPGFDTSVGVRSTERFENGGTVDVFDESNESPSVVGIDEHVRTVDDSDDSKASPSSVGSDEYIETVDDSDESKESLGLPDPHNTFGRAPFMNGLFSPQLIHNIVNTVNNKLARKAQTDEDGDDNDSPYPSPENGPSRVSSKGKKSHMLLDVMDRYHGQLMKHFFPMAPTQHREESRQDPDHKHLSDLQNKVYGIFSKVKAEMGDRGSEEREQSNRMNDLEMANRRKYQELKGKTNDWDMGRETEKAWKLKHRGQDWTKKNKYKNWLTALGFNGRSSSLGAGGKVPSGLWPKTDVKRLLKKGLKKGVLKNLMLEGKKASGFDLNRNVDLQRDSHLPEKFGPWNQMSNSHRKTFGAPGLKAMSGSWNTKANSHRETFGAHGPQEMSGPWNEMSNSHRETFGPPEPKGIFGPNDGRNDPQNGRHHLRSTDLRRGGVRPSDGEDHRSERTDPVFDFPKPNTNPFGHTKERLDHREYGRDIMIDPWKQKAPTAVEDHHLGGFGGRHWGGKFRDIEDRPDGRRLPHYGAQEWKDPRKGWEDPQEWQNPHGLRPGLAGQGWPWNAKMSQESGYLYSR